MDALKRFRSPLASGDESPLIIFGQRLLFSNSDSARGRPTELCAAEETLSIKPPFQTACFG